MNTNDLHFILAFIILVVGLAWNAHKIRRVHLMLFKIDGSISHRLDNVFRQSEALHALQLELNLKKSLPATRGWAASPDFLLEIALHTLGAKPKVIIECSSGVSTIVLARCAQLNQLGHVFSLEHDPEYAKKTRAHLDEHDLSRYATVLDAPMCDHSLGSSKYAWYSSKHLPDAKAIDMIVVDGPPSGTGEQARYPAGPLLFPRLCLGGTVFLDDASRGGERLAIARWQQEIPNLQVDYLACEKGCARITHK